MQTLVKLYAIEKFILTDLKTKLCDVCVCAWVRKRNSAQSVILTLSFSQKNFRREKLTLLSVCSSICSFYHVHANVVWCYHLDEDLCNVSSCECPLSAAEASSLLNIWRKHAHHSHCRPDIFHPLNVFRCLLYWFALDSCAKLTFELTFSPFSFSRDFSTAVCTQKIIQRPVLI